MANSKSRTPANRRTPSKKMKPAKKLKFEKGLEDSSQSITQTPSCSWDSNEEISLATCTENSLTSSEALETVKPTAEQADVNVEANVGDTDRCLHEKNEAEKNEDQEGQEHPEGQGHPEEIEAAPPTVAHGAQGEAKDDA